jgi:hypothetical protein
MNAWYEIRVREVLGSQWSDWFSGMDICTIREGSLETGTLIAGNLVDQAALFGLLTLVRNMNLTLLEVRRVSDPPARTDHINLNE